MALAVLGWILEDTRRAERLLGLTGLTPDALRTGLGDRQVLAAVLEFVSGHEPDLLEAAEMLGFKPEELTSAARSLAQ
ncbi:MAG: DUF3572 family protein [Novosphingobium sp.]|nr:DUF3572 family protein [Novosphingobium sp.]